VSEQCPICRRYFKVGLWGHVQECAQAEAERAPRGYETVRDMIEGRPAMTCGQAPASGLMRSERSSRDSMHRASTSCWTPAQTLLARSNGSSDEFLLA